MKLVGDGYLSESGKILAGKFEADNKAAFDALKAQISKLREFSSSQDVTWGDDAEARQKIVSLVVTARLLEISEAAFIVMQHGMSTEARSLFRVFLDAFFVLGNFCSSKEFVAEYFDSDEADRLKLINAARKHSTEMFQRANDGVSEEDRIDLKNKVEAEKIQAFNSYNLSVKIGCHEIYDSIYRLVSADAHSTPRALEGYLVEDSEGAVIGIRDEPSGEDLKLRLYDYTYFLIKALSGLKELFGHLDQNEIDRMIDALNMVHEK